MRKLASVQKITALEPIEGKDRIVLATVEGWKVIVRKDEFEVGDLCVYVEIDSILPEKPEFEFLRPKKFKIKTMKIGNVYSQGICFKIQEVLPPGFYDEGQDVTDIIGVKKIDEYPEEQQGQTEQKNNNPLKNFLFKHKATRWLAKKIFINNKPKEKFPSFIAKTDEERVQNLPKIISNTELWNATEKIDGTSATYYVTKKKTFFYDKYSYYVCSRNLVVDDKSSFYWKVFNNSRIDELLKMIIDYKDVPWACLQGEIIGPGIQGNKYKRKDYELYGFNLIVPDKTYPWNPQFNKRFPTAESRHIAMTYDIKWVPTVIDDTYLPDSIDKIVEMADGKSVLYDRNREGLVFRTVDGRRSFKAVSNKFLIESGKLEEKEEAKKAA